MRGDLAGGEDASEVDDVLDPCRLGGPGEVVGQQQIEIVELRYGAGPP
jgi:hypothetical protein